MLSAESDVESEKEVYKGSIKGFNWNILSFDDRDIMFLSQKFGINDILAKLLLARGIREEDDVANFLDPKLKNVLIDPFLLKDMDKAVSRVVESIKNKEKITVFGDYDVDGATSSALLRRYFTQIQLDNDVYIPNRMKEGYGPNAGAFDTIKNNGSHLVITVDCGAVSYEPLQHASDIGLDAIVLDHHLGGAKLPTAIAVVNPNRVDETFKYKEIAAVGVSYLFLIALNSTLRKQNWFADNNIAEPNLINLLDLVALGTVCDVMPLRDINRAFVTQGLKIMAKRSNVGIAALADAIKLNKKPQSYHLGFAFGPRINAGGRVGEGLLGSNLLTTDDKDEAIEITKKLNQLNEERKTMEALSLEQAIKSIEDNKLYENHFIVAVGHGWHIGILGILASRIKEKYNKPSAVISINDGVGKGSGRSIPGLDLGSSIACAKTEGILLEGGGHAMAGGFSVEESKIDEFFHYINDKFEGCDDSFSAAKEVNIDAKIELGAVNKSLMDIIVKSEPFGQGNPQPKFMLEEVVVVKITMVGVDHLIVILSNKAVGRGNTVKAVAFNSRNTDLGNFLMQNIGKKVNLIGSLQVNYWDVNKVDFIIDDAARIN